MLLPGAHQITRAISASRNLSRPSLRCRGVPRGAERRGAMPQAEGVLAAALAAEPWVGGA